MSHLPDNSTCNISTLSTIALQLFQYGRVRLVKQSYHSHYYSHTHYSSHKSNHFSRNVERFETPDRTPKGYFRATLCHLDPILST